MGVKIVLFRGFAFFICKCKVYLICNLDKYCGLSTYAGLLIDYVIIICTERPKRKRR
jgi:hypothetical protein